MAIKPPQPNLAVSTPASHPRDCNSPSDHQRSTAPPLGPLSPSSAKNIREANIHFTRSKPPPNSVIPAVAQWESRGFPVPPESPLHRVTRNSTQTSNNREASPGSPPEKLHGFLLQHLCTTEADSAPLEAADWPGPAWPHPPAGGSGSWSGPPFPPRSPRQRCARVRPRGFPTHWPGC